MRSVKHCTRKCERSVKKQGIEKWGQKMAMYPPFIAPYTIRCLQQKSLLVFEQAFLFPYERKNPPTCLSAQVRGILIMSG